MTLLSKVLFGTLEFCANRSGAKYKKIFPGAGYFEIAPTGAAPLIWSVWRWGQPVPTAKRSDLSIFEGAHLPGNMFCTLFRKSRELVQLRQRGDDDEALAVPVGDEEVHLAITSATNSVIEKLSGKAIFYASEEDKR